METKISVWAETGWVARGRENVTDDLEHYSAAVLLDRSSR